MLDVDEKKWKTEINKLFRNQIVFKLKYQNSEPY